MSSHKYKTNYSGKRFSILESIEEGEISADLTSSGLVPKHVI